MTQVTCRHCGKPIGTAGFKGHLLAAHGHADYNAEIKAHGLTRSAGRLVPINDQFKRKYTRRQDAGPRTMTISEEAMAIALTGLERIQADLNRHVEDVRASLNGPVRRTHTDRMQNDLPGSQEGAAPLAETHIHIKGKGEVPKLLWSGGRHWSNDPDKRYLHHANGTLRLDAAGQPRLKGSTLYHGGNKPGHKPTANALRLRQRRADARAASKSAPIRPKANSQDTEGAVQ